MFREFLNFEILHLTSSKLSSSSQNIQILAIVRTRENARQRDQAN